MRCLALPGGCAHYRRLTVAAIFGISILTCGISAGADEWVSGIPWPEVPVVNPGSAQSAPGDAIVLFDGRDLSKWENSDKWTVKDGYFYPAEGASYLINTKQGFGDCQLHIEWASPEKVESEGQGRGNSGVFFMGLYEVQILDSFQNKTYVDGQAAAIYKQRPPLVNVCRKPGEWQSYDIIFEAPRFDAEGKLTRPAYLTVLQNGVLVQNHFEVQGTTAWDCAPHYTAHAAKAPISLQNHGNPVRFRNVWVRELPPADAPPPTKAN